MLRGCRAGRGFGQGLSSPSTSTPSPRIHILCWGCGSNGGVWMCRTGAADYTRGARRPGRSRPARRPFTRPIATPVALSPAPGGTISLSGVIDMNG